MSEDYTWDETVTEHGYAVQNAGLKRDNATLAQRVMELECENAELRARLGAVPVDAIAICLSDSREISDVGRRARLLVFNWMQQAVQP